MNQQDLKDATELLLFVEGRYRAAFGTDPVHTGWRKHIKHMYQSAFGVPYPYTSTDANWAEAWKSYEIPQTLVSGLQFPKWRDETMNEDRKFAYECAKHALRQLQADYDRASAEAESKEELVRKGSISLKELEAAYAAALHKKTVCDAFLLKAKGTVAALEPKP